MLLGIDTATEHAGVSLCKKDEFLFEKIDVKRASETLLKIIDSLIKQAKIELSELKGVIVVKGPGSFTGLRIGVTIANQFAHQLSIPIHGIKTDELFTAFTDEKDFIFVQTMNRDEVYQAGVGKFKNEIPSGVISVKDCHNEISSNGAKWLGQVSEEHEVILGDWQRIKLACSPEQAWGKLAESITFSTSKKYQLEEPFYGKEPNITKSIKS